MTARADGGESGSTGDPDPEAGQQLGDYILRLLDECRDEVKLSDSKSNMLFAGVATVVAILLNIMLDDGSQLRTSGHVVTVLAILTLVTFAASLVLLALAVTPRLGRPEPGKARYFQEHAQFPDSTSLLGAVSLDAENPGARHAQQLYVLSRIVLRKYRHIRTAMQTVSVAMGLLVVVVLISAVR